MDIQNFSLSRKMSDRQLQEVCYWNERSATLFRNVGTSSEHEAQINPVQYEITSVQCGPARSRISFGVDISDEFTEEQLADLAQYIEYLRVKKNKQGLTNERTDPLQQATQCATANQSSSDACQYENSPYRNAIEPYGVVPVHTSTVLVNHNVNDNQPQYEYLEPSQPKRNHRQFRKENSRTNTMSGYSESNNELQLDGNHQFRSRKHAIIQSATFGELYVHASILTVGTIIIIYIAFIFVLYAILNYMHS